jgi:hypothetical protein
MGISQSENCMNQPPRTYYAGKGDIMITHISYSWQTEMSISETEGSD